MSPATPAKGSRMPSNVISIFNAQNSDRMSGVALEKKRIPERFTTPQTIRDEARLNCSFNIMNARPTTETLCVKEYRIWDRYGEATLDRQFFSAAENNPDHLSFMTAFIHSQKLLYLLLCKEFELEYKTEKRELFRIVPTSIVGEMPKAVRKNLDVTQKMWIKDIRATALNQYEVSMTTNYEDIIQISCVFSVLLTKDA